MIIIDSNQESMTPELKLYIEKQIPVLVSPLDTGDMMFVGKMNGEPVKIGMEIKKTPSDLMGSLRDGRLMTQLPRLTEEFDMSYLLFVGENIKVDFNEGKVQERFHQSWKTSAFSYHYLNSILTRFEASGGRIRTFENMEHLAVFVFSLFRWWTKETHTEEVFYKKRHKFLDWKLMDEPLIEIYERMGIGVKRATVLAEKYPTMFDLVLADEKELNSLPNFGKKTVSKMMKYIKR